MNSMKAIEKKVAEKDKAMIKKSYPKGTKAFSLKLTDLNLNNIWNK